MKELTGIWKWEEVPVEGDLLLVFHFWSSTSDRAVAADATFSFFGFTFLKVIVLANFDIFFVWLDCERHESRAKNIITQRVTLGEHGLATGSYDGVPWLVSYHAETKGLWNHRKQNNQRAGAHSKKSSAPQKHNMIQDVAVPGHLMKDLV